MVYSLSASHPAQQYKLGDIIVWIIRLVIKIIIAWFKVISPQWSRFKTVRIIIITLFWVALHASASGLCHDVLSGYITVAHTFWYTYGSHNFGLQNTVLTVHMFSLCNNHSGKHWLTTKDAVLHFLPSHGDIHRYLMVNLLTPKVSMRAIILHLSLQNKSVFVDFGTNVSFRTGISKTLNNEGDTYLSNLTERICSFSVFGGGGGGGGVPRGGVQ